ncbi:MAG: phosphoribosyltransferase family protein, partial [Acidobacteriota bacterium]
MDIERDYADSSNFLCIGVLKGSVFFLTDLLKHIERPLKVDFMQTSSYRDSTTPGEVRLKRDLDLSVLDADVLLIEDIVDTGHTLRTVLDLLEGRGARTVKLCSLL